MDQLRDCAPFPQGNLKSHFPNGPSPLKMSEERYLLNNAALFRRLVGMWFAQWYILWVSAPGTFEPATSSARPARNLCQISRVREKHTTRKRFRSRLSKR